LTLLRGDAVDIVLDGLLVGGDGGDQLLLTGAEPVNVQDRVVDASAAIERLAYG